MVDGPRALGAEEWDSLRALTDAVFRPGMPEQYPQLFDEANRENLRVCVDGGRCVSHVGMTERGATLFGCSLGVCSVGAVATHPDSRGRGLASACFDDAVDKAARDGMDVMLVSGDRSLYRRRGCLEIGGDAAFTLTPAQAGALDESARLSVTVSLMTDQDLPLVRECYRAEPVRFVRAPDDYHFAQQSGLVMDSACDFWVVRERGAFRAYAVVERRDDGLRVRLLEFAGDRRALLAALPGLIGRVAPAALQWQVARHDGPFRSLCEGAGLAPTPAPSPGTVKLLRFVPLMERMRPRWEELLGARDAARLSFRQSGDQYAFGFGGDTLPADRDRTTRLLFHPAAVSALTPGPCADVLRQILPLPWVWPGINYV